MEVRSLAAYDGNVDTVIDERDPIWASLLVWTDSNHDGISQQEEMQRITDSPVTAIDLDYHWTGRRDASVNVFRYESQVHIGHQVCRCYDVYLLVTL